MSVIDRKIKNIDVRVKDANGRVRVVNLIEHDTVNLKFKDIESSKTVHIETGEIIKIGVHQNESDGSESIYLVIIAYNYYLDNNIFYVPVSTLTQIITVNHSSTQYTITPVYTADESVALLRSDGEQLEFTTNGKDWIKCNGGSGSDITIHDVDVEIEKYLRDYSTTEDVEEKISEATVGLITEGRALELIDSATSSFVTAEQVDSKIDDAVADFVTMEQVDSEIDTKVSEATADFVTDEQVNAKISEATADFVTADQVTSIVDNATKDFVTGAQVDSKIDDAVADFVTMEQVDSEITEKTADFVTGEQVDTKISEATADFVTATQVDEKIEEATSEFVTMPEVDSEIDIKLEPYATLNSPTFTGDVSVPTVEQTVDDDTAASTSYVRTSISNLKQELAGALHFKGVVANMEELEAIVDPGEGDVYQVTESPSGSDAEYVYTLEKGWVELGTVIDLTNYATLDDLDRVAENTLASANSYTDEAVQNIDPYLLSVEKGYVGSRDDFYTALADVLNHVTVIPTVDQFRE